MRRTAIIRPIDADDALFESDSVGKPESSLASSSSEVLEATSARSCDPSLELLDVRLRLLAVDAESGRVRRGVRSVLWGSLVDMRIWEDNGD